jgi:hypothetical protein
MDITDFTIQNPWWKGRSHIKDDTHIINFSDKKYKWHSPVLDELELIPGNIYSIRGPSQVTSFAFSKPKGMYILSYTL